MESNGHNLVFESETADAVLYRCSVCAQAVGFAKPHTGQTPAATADTLPEDAGVYLDACTPPAPDPVATAQLEQEVVDLRAQLDRQADQIARLLAALGLS